MSRRNTKCGNGLRRAQSTPLASKEMLKQRVAIQRRAHDLRRASEFVVRASPTEGRFRKQLQIVAQTCKGSTAKSPRKKGREERCQSRWPPYALGLAEDSKSRIF